MRRPGPLQDLLLSRYVPAEHMSVTSPFSSTVKRPLSPGVALFSPTKRRILNEEGLLTPRESKRSPHGSRMTTSDATDPHAFARRLDFGTPGRVSDAKKDRPATPIRRTTTAVERLAPSPEFVLPPKKEGHNPFIEPASLPVAPRPSTSTNPGSFMIPREVPPSPDRQSFHYPGFDVFRDKYIEILSSATLTGGTMMDSVTDPESTKENIPLRRKTKKAVSAPAVVQTTESGLLKVGSVKKAQGGRLSMLTPDILVGDTSTTLQNSSFTANSTPRKVTALSHGFTPGKTPQTGKERKLHRKMTMEKEVDDFEGDDDDTGINQTDF